MFKKYRYIISEMIMQRKPNRTGTIVIIGTAKDKLVKRKKRRLLIRALKKREIVNYKKEIIKERSEVKTTNRTKSRLTVYLLTYIKEILGAYLQTDNKLSYREQKKVYKNSETLLKYITNNQTSIQKMMRRVLRKVKQESVKKQR